MADQLQQSWNTEEIGLLASFDQDVAEHLQETIAKQSGGAAAAATPVSPPNSVPHFANNASQVLSLIHI